MVAFMAYLPSESRQLDTKLFFGFMAFLIFCSAFLLTILYSGLCDSVLEWILPPL